jgi:acetylornithine deacetylase/succinyl-diaminopimelate desuccinylase-like protein
MDTVYPLGMLSGQPFKIEGDRAYGLGIADDKQGIAVILHTLSMLRSLNFREYGTLTVLINGDEEISSPGSRFLIEKLGREHDAVLSFEGGGSPQVDQIRLATSGIGAATITVRGRASHAGAAPHRRHQVRRRLPGAVGGHEEHGGAVVDRHDRAEVAQRVVGQPRIDRGVGGMHAGGHQQRIAIRRRLRDQLRGQDGTGASAILDDDGLAPDLLQRFLQQPRRKIRGSTHRAGVA